MEFIAKFLGYLYLAVSILIVVVIIGTILFLYFYIQRKKHAQSTSVSERESVHLDYNSFKRVDATEYVKFDDIIDFRWGGAIVTDNGTRFVAGLSINGYDFDMASAEERYQSMAGMIRMTNILSGSITVRQDARVIDLTDNIRKCEACVERLQGELETLQANYWELRGTIEELAALGSDDALMHYQNLLAQNLGEQQAVTNLMKEQNAIIEELHETSGENVMPERNASYLVDWVYDPANFASRALNKQEVYREARRRLYDRLEILADALSQCGVKAKKMSCEELLQAQYHHFHPYSASKFRMEDILGSSYFHLFTTLDDSEIQMEVAAEREAEKQRANESVPYEIQLMEQEARERELLRKYGQSPAEETGHHEDKEDSHGEA